MHKHAGIGILLLLVLAVPTRASLENTITFDNKSGDVALVKLVGPTAVVVEIPDAMARTVAASEGSYYIKIRYGGGGAYRYSKGEFFEVVETPTTRSDIIITLHKVPGGNYPTRPISKEEFEQQGFMAREQTPGNVVHREGSRSGGTIPAGTPVFSILTEQDSSCPPVLVSESDQKRCSLPARLQKYDVLTGGVTEAGRQLGYTSRTKIGHSFWGDDDKNFKAYHVILKGGYHGLGFVHAEGVFSAYQFNPEYTFGGTVFSAHVITAGGRTFPYFTKVYSVDHRWVREEEAMIFGKRCCKIDPIATEVSELGQALGYSVGTPVGASFWAEWRPSDRYAANPVAACTKAAQ